MLKLKDYVQITPDPKFRNLEKQEKFRLIDSAVAGKALYINLAASHSGKRINNRVYSPMGQRLGAASFTDPYNKPVIRNHDTGLDPIGRAVGGHYLDTTDKSLKFFRTVNQYQDLQDSYDRRDFEKVSALLHKSGVLLRKDWEGLGELGARIRITDAKAIESFLNEEYLTFSVGFNTDHAYCSICLSDWWKGDICDHQPGSLVDGKPALLLLNAYEVDELSVVNQPADKRAIVYSMELSDSVKTKFSDENFVLEPEFTDSMYEVQEPRLEPKNMREMLADAEQMKALMDQVTGKSLTEEKILLSIHDSLHSMWDYVIKYGDVAAIPKDVFALHAELHAWAVSSHARDSFMNGALDQYSATGEETGEFEYEVMSEDSEGPSLQDLLNEIKKITGPIDAVTTELKPTDTIDLGLMKLTEEVHALRDSLSKEKEEETETRVQGCDCDCGACDDLTDLEIDWKAFDAELDAEMGDAKLSGEKRESLPSSSFCGPDKSFPVPDCGHVTAARRLIGRSKYDQPTKDRILACVNRKAKNMSCDVEEKNQDLLDSFTSLQQDYVSATKLLESANAFKDAVQKLVTGEAAMPPELQTEDWHQTLSKAFERKTIEHVDNPSVASTDVKIRLSGYEQDFVTRYKKLIDAGKAGEAHKLFISERKYLPAGFNPKDY